MAAKTTASQVYRGYMPINLPQHRPPNKIKPYWKVIGKPKLTIYPPPEVEEWSKEPEYPPIVYDGSRKEQKKKCRLEWYDKLRSIDSAEEKMYEIARQGRIYSAIFRNFWMPTYDSLPVAQHLTYTHLVKNLPEKFRQSIGTDNKFSGEMIEKMTDLLLDRYACHKHVLTCPPRYYPDQMKMRDPQQYRQIELIQDIVSSARRLLIPKNPLILNAQIDLDPTVNSWWWHSGFPAPNKKKWWKSRTDPDTEHVTNSIQVRGKTALNIRTDLLLESIVDQDDPLVVDTKLLKENVSDKIKSVSLWDYGAKFFFRYPVVMAGFNYTPHQEEYQSFDCPHTTFLTMDSLRHRNILNDSCLAVPLKDDENCLNTQAIMGSFSWLNSLSAYHGFTTYNELTYPMTCQTVTTDGQNWIFHVYQMNTHSFHRDLGQVQKNNICWSSGPMQLFSNQNDGQFKDVNPEVARILIQFLTNEPSINSNNSQLRPYLAVDKRTKEEKLATQQSLKKLFENRYVAFLNSYNRIPLWEHIFIRSKEGRNTLPHIKTKHKLEWPKYPDVFE